VGLIGWRCAAAKQSIQPVNGRLRSVLEQPAGAGQAGRFTPAEAGVCGAGSSLSGDSLGFSGQVTTTNGGLPVGVTNCTSTWPEFTGPDAKTCRVGED
jgi:hypothetical protein